MIEGAEQLLGAAIPHRDLVNASGRDIQGGNECLGAMTNVFKFDASTAAWLQSNIGQGALQGLNPRHFIDPKGQLARLSSGSRLLVDCTDVFNFGFEGWVGGDWASSGSGGV